MEKQIAKRRPFILNGLQTISEIGSYFSSSLNKNQSISRGMTFNFSDVDNWYYIWNDWSKWQSENQIALP